MYVVNDRTNGIERQPQRVLQICLLSFLRFLRLPWSHALIFLLSASFLFLLLLTRNSLPPPFSFPPFYSTLYVMGGRGFGDGLDCSASCFALSAAAVTADMTVARNAPFSKASIPAIVVPPGLATWSLSTPGCSPVSCTMVAAPLTVCVASCMAMFRGRPARTPPSARASMRRKI